MGISKTNVENVLRAWHLIEVLSPSSVNGIGETLEKKHFHHDVKVHKTEQVLFSDQPWEVYKLKNNEKKNIQFRYYIGCFEQHKLVQHLRELFHTYEEMINRDHKMLFSMSFQVDHAGKYLKNSLFVPVLMYVIKLLKKRSKATYDQLLTKYNDYLRLFEEQVDDLFINGVSEKSLKKVSKLYQRYFLQIDDWTIHYAEKEIIEIGKEAPFNNFNSFFLDDLGEIISKGENQTLHQFIKGADNHTEIDENRAYIEDVLQPKYLPNGRWPSPVEHRLSLMQQVAVNQIINNSQKINSVNGPPGTGKTTLLKDVFAHLIVERAEKMTHFKNPEEAFKKMKKIVLDNYPYNIYELDESIKKYSIVVTSSNNGAVENISKDLPKKKEIIRQDGKGKFIEYDKAYASEAEELSLYPCVAKALLSDNEETWGLFSAALGKSTNFAQYFKNLLLDENALIRQLEQDKEKVNLSDWKAAIEDFNNTLNSVEKKKAELQSMSENFVKYKDIDSELSSLQIKHVKVNQEINQQLLKKESVEKQNQIDLNINIFQRIFNKKRDKNERERHEINKIINSLEKKRNRLKKKIGELRQRSEKSQKSIEDKCTYQGMKIPTDDYWGEDQYENRQTNTIWITDELNFERGQLFLKAMKIHKLFLLFNHRAIKSSLRLLNFRYKLDLNQADHRMHLKNVWEIIHLITPVISTTFASFSKMYKGIGQDFISYLFIDEAGQATPQQAAGALWRSQKAIVVGDPLQIEPVVSIDRTILGDIKRYYEIDDEHIELGASVQTLADRANSIGTYNKDQEWIGIPLWVHRRCLDPMFTISNEIAYDNKMVLPEKEQGQSKWIDINGKAINRQFVEEQAEWISEEIYKKWTSSSELPNIYVISPFTAVKNGLKKNIRSYLKKKGLPKQKVEGWIKNSVGTVHTFQGKEAEIVYFVVGTDENSDGAANWSCSKPNLINVAVTRAKKEFYIVGDYQRISKKQYYQVIAENVVKVEVQSYQN
ncbi:ATP-binding protein [Bacillus safensis]|uniref:DEAD/DEAH box helicase n=1 Tax=Bacillus safensis TaxID=561879 RepID=UPI002E2B1CB4|nr:ATP-binding protein [Bacillus safensis]MED5224298.1 ATP-binding protein [Bacillus safensis]